MSSIKGDRVCGVDICLSREECRSLGLLVDLGGRSFDPSGSMESPGAPDGVVVFFFWTVQMMHVRFAPPLGLR